MEYDAAWCPVCDRQIIPKHIHLPIPPPKRSKLVLIKRYPAKFRTLIDQGPIPLYCSDDCRLADLDHVNPQSPSSPLPANTFAAPSETENGSALSSIDSLPSSSSCVSDPSHYSPSMATLAAIYNFPPPPARPPVLEDTSLPDSESHFTNSVSPKPVKRAPYPFSQPPEPRKPVPSWSDTCNASRASIYRFSSPRKVRDPSSTDETTRAYRSPNQSHGIYSTLGDSAASAPRNGALLPTATHDLIQKYTQSLNQRSESRLSTRPGSTPTSPTSTHSFPTSKPTPRCRERPIVQRGAEGKLLVPDVKLKVYSGSIASSDSIDKDIKLGTAKRPAVETHSWSYDNIKTYPIMQLPPKKEKQIRKQIVDGREVEVKLEVVVQPTFKRLFLFSPSHRQA